MKIIKVTLMIIQNQMMIIQKIKIKRKIILKKVQQIKIIKKFLKNFQKGKKGMK